MRPILTRIPTPFPPAAPPAADPAATRPLYFVPPVVPYSRVRARIYPVVTLPPLFSPIKSRRSSFSYPFPLPTPPLLHFPPKKNPKCALVSFPSLVGAPPPCSSSPVIHLPHHPRHGVPLGLLQPSLEFPLLSRFLFSAIKALSPPAKAPSSSRSAAVIDPPASSSPPLDLPHDILRCAPFLFSESPPARWRHHLPAVTVRFPHYRRAYAEPPPPPPPLASSTPWCSIIHLPIGRRLSPRRRHH